jgi:phosphatidylcholine synthase
VGGRSEFSQIVAAWSVHLYTTLGAVLGAEALRAVFRNDYRSAFLLLAAALAIDSSDGALARAARVKQVLPWIDGELLDNVIDYLNYVMVPVAVFMQPGLLPESWEFVAWIVLIASAYGFCRTDAKGVIEHYFRGFPSYWNIMAFYFVVLDTPPWLNLFFVVGAAVMVFVPMRWLYPSRMETMRVPTIALGVVWAILALAVIVRLPDPSPFLAWASLFYPIYYTLASVVFHLRSRRA